MDYMSVLPPNSHIKTPISNMMVLGGGRAFGRQLCHEGGVLIMKLVSFKETPVRIQQEGSCL